MQGELADQVDTLFRRQNQASHTVMLLIMEETSSANLDKLEKVEQEMLIACKALNEYAVLERDQQKIGLAQKRKIIHSINQCDKKTKQLEFLLNTYFESEKIIEE